MGSRRRECVPPVEVTTDPTQVLWTVVGSVLRLCDPILWTDVCPDDLHPFRGCSGVRDLLLGLGTVPYIGGRLEILSNPSKLSPPARVQKVLGFIVDLPL